MIAIIDYGMGNLRSVEKAFEACGASPKVTSSARDIENAAKIVLPGVGAFTAAVGELKKRKLFDLVKKRLQSGVPYLGLCLGLQLLFEESEESEGKTKAPGFGLIKGKVRRFRLNPNFKIPHMGWNEIRIRKKNCPLFKGIKNEDYFYFVHSYYGVPKDESWNAAVTDYGVRFSSAVWKETIFATQFHPEKSQSSGLKIIKNFAELK